MDIIDGKPIQALIPLPSASLFIDLRGHDIGNVQELLKFEIEDLAGEMQLHNIPHWRYLRDFLSFEQLPLLGSGELEQLQQAQKAKTPSSSPPPVGPISAAGPAADTTLPVMGEDDPSGQRGRLFLPERGTHVAQVVQGHDAFDQSVQRLILEIDRIRNNRITAVGDLPEKDSTGPNRKKATVHIIFLTDAQEDKSLGSAAAYAAALKEYYRKHEYPGYKAMIHTVVLCLNNSGEIGPPTKLIQHLRWQGGWDHLNMLMLTEKYRSDGARMDPTVQTYLAEILLYVLLVIPISRMDAAQQEFEAYPPIPANSQGEWVSLLDNTYLIGLSAVEHSARWGRRLINMKLTKQVVDYLREEVSEDEKQHIKDDVAIWFNDWRLKVRQAVPDNLPGRIPALAAFAHISKLLGSQVQVFRLSKFSLSLQDSSIEDLKDYKTGLAETYALSLKEREAKISKAAQESSTQSVVSLPATLKDTVDSIHVIEENVREWGSGDLRQSQRTVLFDALAEAQEVLCQEKFFVGAHGAIPRAEVQLDEVAVVADGFQKNHQKVFINMEGKRADLEKKADQEIAAFDKNIKRWPVLGAWRFSRLAIATLAFGLLLFLGVATLLTAFAWLSHLELLKINSFLSLLRNPALDMVALVVLLTESYFFGRLLFGKDASPLRVESILVIVLLVIAVWGGLEGFALNSLSADTASRAIISWLAFLPPLSTLALAIAFVVVFVESVYFRWWFNRVRKERERIVKNLQQQCQKDIDEVKTFLAEGVALQLLHCAELIDGRGNAGEYLHRIQALHAGLEAASAEADSQQRLATDRLKSSVSIEQPGAVPSRRGRSLSLQIREELLDVQALMAAYDSIGADLHRLEELREFAEILLQAEGSEVPIFIEEQCRKKPFQGDRSKHSAQLLMDVSAGAALRWLPIVPPSGLLLPLERRYKELNNNPKQPLTTIGTFIQGLKQDSEMVLHPRPGDEKTANEMTTKAFATWTQLLWELSGQKPLPTVLSAEGVMPKALRLYGAEGLKSRLLGRMSLTGFNNIQVGLKGKVYWLLPASPRLQDFLTGNNMSTNQVTVFPDIERALFLYLERYETDPLFIPAPPPPAQLGTGSGASPGPQTSPGASQQGGGSSQGNQASQPPPAQATGQQPGASSSASSAQPSAQGSAGASSAQPGTQGSSQPPASPNPGNPGP